MQGRGLRRTNPEPVLSSQPLHWRGEGRGKEKKQYISPNKLGSISCIRHLFMHLNNPGSAWSSLPFIKHLHNDSRVIDDVTLVSPTLLSWFLECCIYCSVLSAFWLLHSWLLPFHLKYKALSSNCFSLCLLVPSHDFNYHLFTPPHLCRSSFLLRAPGWHSGAAPAQPRLAHGSRPTHWDGSVQSHTLKS